MKLSGLIIETSPVHSTKSARPLSIVKFVFLCDNEKYYGTRGVPFTPTLQILTKIAVVVGFHPKSTVEVIFWPNINIKYIL